MASAHAQIKASERGGVHQTIDGTTITVEYARPRARGRSPLFGGDVVHWDHLWTPGADWATTIEIDKPVTIQGHDVPVGKYSVWFVVQDTIAWEVWLELPRFWQESLNRRPRAARRFPGLPGPPGVRWYAGWRPHGVRKPASAGSNWHWSVWKPTVFERGEVPADGRIDVHSHPC